MARWCSVHWRAECLCVCVCERTKARAWPAAYINSIINYPIRSRSTMDTLPIKPGASGRDVCCAVFCMTVPLVGTLARTRAHTCTRISIWWHGTGRSPSSFHSSVEVAGTMKQQSSRQSNDFPEICNWQRFPFSFAQKAYEFR